jgi:cytochrome c oxidase subunit 3
MWCARRPSRATIRRWSRSALFPTEATGGVWPPKGILPFDPLSLPLLNTLILLTSGVTVTWAHHALREGDRQGLLQGLGLTVLLGLCFTGVQAYEYSHAAFGFREGIYPSTFFMATGFHGFHVIIGTIFLIVCWFRAYRGDFKPDHHFGFEAAAWYWHFVDVVWLFLFICVYLWGGGPGPYAVH